MNEGMQMMRRYCGLSAVVLCVGLVSCVLAGCFGGGEEPAATTSQVTVPGSGVTMSSLPVTTTIASALIDGLPSEYVNALGKQPIVVVFYASGGVDDNKVVTAVRALQPLYGGYTFLVYDYRDPKVYGDLAKTLEGGYGLDLGYLPVTLLIRRDGLEAAKWSGYVDQGTLNQVLINLGHF